MATDGRTRITLSASDTEVFDIIDDERELVYRSPFICDILERYYGVGRHKGKTPLKNFNKEAEKGKGKK